MNTTRLFILQLSLLLIGSLFSTLSGKPTALYQEVDVIIIDVSTQNPGGAPRGPAFNPFTAYRQGNTVVLNCSVEYGVFEITLLSTAGDNITTVFHTENESMVIPVSGLPGDYFLLLTGESGYRFSGAFAI